jgi:hypothetical protein
MHRVEKTRFMSVELIVVKTFLPFLMGGDRHPLTARQNVSQRRT